MEKKDRSIVVLALIGFGVIYVLYKKKPKAAILEEQPSGGGGGGVFGGGFMPIFIPPAPAPKPAEPTPPPAETQPKPVFKDKGSGGSTVTCGSGYTYDFAKAKCVPIEPVEDKGGSSKPPSGGSTSGGSTSGGGGSFPVLNPYDPCKTNGYGGTYDVASNQCKNTPMCSGGNLQLDDKGKMLGCSVAVPTTGDVSGGVVIGGNVSNMPAGTIGGAVVPFSGKVPLTLDNLLM